MVECHQDIIDVCETWMEANGMLSQCVAEYVNAVGMCNQARIRECKKWVAEALQSETDARSDMLNALKAMGLQAR